LKSGAGSSARAGESGHGLALSRSGPIYTHSLSLSISNLNNLLHAGTMASPALRRYAFSHQVSLMRQFQASETGTWSLCCYLSSSSSFHQFLRTDTGYFSYETDQTRYQLVLEINSRPMSPILLHQASGANHQHPTPPRKRSVSSRLQNLSCHRSRI